MNIPKEFAFIIPFIAIVISLIVAILSWRYADFFLSRRDHYVNSRYELLIKKLGWFISSFFTTLFIIFKILEVFILKNK